MLFIRQGSRNNQQAGHTSDQIIHHCSNTEWVEQYDGFLSLFSQRLLNF